MKALSFRSGFAVCRMAIAAMSLFLALPLHADTLALTAYAPDGHSLSTRQLEDFITPASLPRGEHTSGLLVSDLDGNPVSEDSWVETSSSPVVSWTGAPRVELLLPWPVSDGGFAAIVLDNDGRGYAGGGSINLNEEIALAEYRWFRSLPGSHRHLREIEKAIKTATGVSSGPERAALFDKILSKMVAAVGSTALGEAALIEKAKRQPLLTVYTNHLSYGPLLIENFLKRYPFVRINHQFIGPLGGETAGNFLTVEQFREMDPKLRADVMLRGEIYNLLLYIHPGVYARLDDLPNWGRRTLHPKEDPRYYFFTGNVVVLIYNKRLIRETDLPRSLDELVQPQWKDKVVLRNPTKGQSGAFLEEYVNSTRGNLDWYRALARNGAHLSEKGGEVFFKVLRGEVPIGIFRDVEFLNLMSLFKNRPNIESIGMHILDAETPYQFHLGIVNTFAPHPYTARLFMNWVLSDDARNVLEKAGYSAGRRQSEHLKRPRVWFLDYDTSITENDARLKQLLDGHDARLDQAVRLMCEEHVKLDKGSRTCSAPSLDIAPSRP